MIRYVIAFLCSIIFMLNGCASVPLTHYYTLEPNIVGTGQASSAKYAYTLGIENYEADMPYQQDRIVFRTSPYEVNFYEYHRWLRPPTELVTEQLHALLVSSKLFAKVHTFGYDAYADFLVRGRIVMFEQWIKPKETSFVRVGIQHELVDLSHEQTLWTEIIETTADIPETTLLATIKAFETALRDNISLAITAIDGELTD